MNGYTQVYIDDDDLYNMLYDRLTYWIKNEDSNEFKTFMEYYGYLIDSGCFGGAKFSVNCIVDNDYINNFAYYGLEYSEIKRAIKEHGKKLKDRIAFKCEYGFLVGY